MKILYTFYIYTIFFLHNFILSSSNFCNYGEYFKNNSCFPCEKNTYSNYKNSEICFNCPPSSINNRTSSKYIYDCSCESNYYLNHMDNSCDSCFDLNNNFYCENNLNELYIDDIEAFFFKKKEEFPFKNFDRCLIKQDKKNIYPFMNNVYIYCKRADICLDICGKCSEYNEGFICNNCIKKYFKNIYLKYSKCKRCYKIIVILLIIIIYCFILFIFFFILLKYINISLYFHHFNIYEKGTIYFLHYFREFTFYLSLIFILSILNDITENEKEHYNSYEKKNYKGLYLYNGNIKIHYLLNIYMHNFFFDLIKIIHLNFINFFKIDCFYSNNRNSKIHTLQVFIFVFILLIFISITLICNFIFLYLRKKGINLLKDYGKIGDNLLNEDNLLNSNNEIEKKKKKIQKFKYFFLYPLFLPNYVFCNYVNVKFFYYNDTIDFLKTSFQIVYYQFIFITLYVCNSIIIFIFISSHICIGLFSYYISYYDTITMCYNNFHFKMTKFMTIPIILCFCFLFYLVLFIYIFIITYNFQDYYKYKYIYGFYTFLYNKNKCYYFILKILFINILFISTIQLPDFLSCLVYVSFLFLFLICLSLFINPFIKIKNYNLKLESFFIMFLFFFNLQLEQIRIITYNITLRILLSFITLFIYSFILFYYLYYMLKDIYLYFSLYVKYIKMKSGSNIKIRKNIYDSSTNDFFFHYYLKNKMNIDLYYNEDNKKKLSQKNNDEVFLESCDVSNILYKKENSDEIKNPYKISKKDTDYIYNQCVLISPFIPETITQLLFITKNINYIIRLKTKEQYMKIYNFLFENGYIEIQKTSIDRFISKSQYIYKKVFNGNYQKFRQEMINIFANIVKNLKCFRDIYVRECIAKKIKDKYKINEIDKNKIKYDENYEQKNINTFLYKLRDLNKNSNDKNHIFFQLFPSTVVLKRVQKKKKKKKNEIQNLNNLNNL
ncbi:conserved Plasmodium membrane protein, unknown function [Plasmodium gallinaceum]|uniref:Tyrosine-protein kinase ephrin type A/B receptor-like domain-containing protein n=1 Tax=Plasmodium gallinaceum TaxID=5849 RepID=A0A1J1GVS7_PLAGA|nr:conserved Plasmodium membrane protein, unknown function [Plasmodium gallinaceum]CRG96566.1 conserved Plasmodium membrane protein, unknown function [Plasmodium gallinaceum]